MNCVGLLALQQLTDSCFCCQAGLLDGVIAVYNVSSSESHPHYDTMYVAFDYQLSAVYSYNYCTMATAAVHYVPIKSSPLEHCQ